MYKYHAEFEALFKNSTITSIDLQSPNSLTYFPVEHDFLDIGNIQGTNTLWLEKNFNLILLFKVYF